MDVEVECKSAAAALSEIVIWEQLNELSRVNVPCREEGVGRSTDVLIAEIR